MTSTTTTDESLKVDLRTKAAELFDIDGAQFNRSNLVAEFVGRGVSKTTIYRIIGEVVAGKNGAAPKLFRRATVAKLAGQAIEQELVPVLPREDISSECSRNISLTDRINRCVEVSEKLLAFCFHDDGRIKSHKLLLSANEHMRKNLETILKIFAAAKDYALYDKTMTAIFEEVSAESPECAARITARLRRVNELWT